MQYVQTADHEGSKDFSDQWLLPAHWRFSRVISGQLRYL